MSAVKIVLRLFVMLFTRSIEYPEFDPLGVDLFTFSIRGLELRIVYDVPRTGAKRPVTWKYRSVDSTTMLLWAARPWTPYQGRWITPRSPPTMSLTVLFYHKWPGRTACAVSA
jgi:hypothetical protein